MSFHQLKQTIKKWQPNPALRVVEFFVLGGIVLAFVMPLFYEIFPANNNSESQEISSLLFSQNDFK